MPFDDGLCAGQQEATARHLRVEGGEAEEAGAASRAQRKVSAARPPCGLTCLKSSTASHSSSRPSSIAGGGQGDDDTATAAGGAGADTPPGAAAAAEEEEGTAGAAAVAAAPGSVCKNSCERAEVRGMRAAVRGAQEHPA